MRVLVFGFVGFKILESITVAFFKHKVGIIGKSRVPNVVVRTKSNDKLSGGLPAIQEFRTPADGGVKNVVSDGAVF